MTRTHSMSIQTGRGRRGDRQLVPRYVICMGGRDKTARLPAAYIDRQLGLRQKKSGVVMKQAESAPNGES
jgi:hypothetical protein